MSRCVTLLRRGAGSFSPVSLMVCQRAAVWILVRAYSAVAKVQSPAPGIADLSAVNGKIGPPITFGPARGILDAAGARMRVAQLDHLSGTQPYFLDDLAHRQVLSWASGAPSMSRGDSKLLALTGPVKSGKSTLLRALPQILAARLIKERGRRRQPVPFLFTFPQRCPPEPAALALVDAVISFARQLGVDISPPVIANRNVLPVFPRVVHDLSEAIYAAGGELVLLLDETQAPVVAAGTNKNLRVDADFFVSQLKNVHDQCYQTSRIAITGGGGMLPLLDSIRHQAPNGYVFWDSLSRVHLGATPSPAAALAMAAKIVRCRSHSWPKPARKLVTAAHALATLEAATMDGAQTQLGPTTAPRPAMVAHLLDIMESLSAAVGRPEEVVRLLAHKLHEEAHADAALFLATLARDVRTFLFDVADGMVIRSTTMLAELSLEAVQKPRFKELLDTICEPGEPGSVLKLIPPYGVIFLMIEHERKVFGGNTYEG